jgi:prefoldin beta subunit
MTTIEMKLVQDRLAVEANELHALQKDLSRTLGTRQQFAQQHSENSMVFKELEKLDDDANVYKLVGSVLIKQDLVEAKGNVTKRLEFIQNETDRLDKNVRGLESKQDAKHKEVNRLRQTMHGLVEQKL